MIKINRELTINNISNVVNEMSPSFSGIVGQECKGELWVNNIAIPTIAIAWSYAVGSYAFLGTSEREEEYSELKWYLETAIFPSLKEKGEVVRGQI